MQVDLSDKFGQNGIVSLLVGGLYKNSLITKLGNGAGCFQGHWNKLSKKIFADLEKNIEKIIEFINQVLKIN